MPSLLLISLILLLAYLLGSLPFGYWLVLWRHGVDIRTEGSGGTGMTNVKRVAGWPLALITLFLDALKGALAVFLAVSLLPALDFYPVLAGLLAIIGHSKSIWIGFKGGKSVATSLGVFLMLQPLIIAIAAAVAIITMLLTRYVSLGSMLGAVLALALSLVFVGTPVLHQVLFAVVALYIVWLHRANIQRLRQGCENQLVLK